MSADTVGIYVSRMHPGAALQLFGYVNLEMSPTTDPADQQANVLRAAESMIHELFTRWARRAVPDPAPRGDGGGPPDAPQEPR